MDAKHNLSVTVPMTYDHAPYMGQHDYLNKTVSTITVAPGKTTGWVEVGGMMVHPDQDSFLGRCPYVPAC